MGAAQILDKGEYHSPREAGFVRCVDRSDCLIKLSAIHVSGLDALEEPAIDAAAECIQTAELADHPAFSEKRQLGAGFAILHVGDEGVWLLLQLWLTGGIASRHLWRADIDTPARFEQAPDHLMACVWELAIIDFERRAWIQTAMSGQSLDAYFQYRLPRETV